MIISGSIYLVVLLTAVRLSSMDGALSDFTHLSRIYYKVENYLKAFRSEGRFLLQNINKLYKTGGV